MEIIRAGSRPSAEGPADWFTGDGAYRPAIRGPEPSRAAANAVTFEPGARTAWHTHPLGQMLIVTSGYGRVQREGGPVEDIRPGDVVRFAPGEKHWHGAAPQTAMTHIAIQESLDGKAVEWMEHVTDEEYGSGPGRIMSKVIVVIGAGSIGQAIARRVSAGKHVASRRPAAGECRRGSQGAARCRL